MNYKMNRLLRVMLIICITILLSVHNLCAQEVWEELAEQLMDEDENSSFQWDTHFEELSELRENPININTATKEQLERFPFLSDQLVENILYYLYKYGPMLTRNELWMIEDIDRQTIHYLLPEGGNLAASKIRNLECPNYEICLIDYGCGKFNRKIHIMEQYP